MSYIFQNNEELKEFVSKHSLADREIREVYALSEEVFTEKLNQWQCIPLFQDRELCFFLKEEIENYLVADLEVMRGYLEMNFLTKEEAGSLLGVTSRRMQIIADEQGLSAVYEKDGKSLYYRPEFLKYLKKKKEKNISCAPENVFLSREQIYRFMEKELVVSRSEAADITRQSYQGFVQSLSRGSIPIYFSKGEKRGNISFFLRKDCEDYGREKRKR